jgi:CobQ-like glutamine amidotransferase family enzyme
MTAGPSAVRVAVVFPDLLGTYGDGGNAQVLAARLRARRTPVDLVTVASDAVLPTECDIYLLGGAEDGPQPYVAERLCDGRLGRAVRAGAAVLAVCGGLQVLGERFSAGGREWSGLSLLPCVTYSGAGLPRAVGDVLALADPDLGIPELIGFENHAGRTRLLAGARPLGRLQAGHGNEPAPQGQQPAEGVREGRVTGTYLHGPVLALNPALADVVLHDALGALPAADPDVAEPLATAIEAARARRRARIGSSARTGSTLRTAAARHGWATRAEPAARARRGREDRSPDAPVALPAGDSQVVVLGHGTRTRNGPPGRQPRSV